MDLASLAVFRAVAREQSVTRAADQLGRVPSSVTTRIQQLEAELGAMLFERGQRRMVLTAKGRAYLAYAERILALADEARQVLHPEQPCGTLRVGSMESTAASRLPEPLARFNRAHPEVRIDLATGPSAPLLEALRAGRIDAALVALSDEVEREGLAARPVFAEELWLLLPPDHPPVVGPQDILPRALAAFASGCTYRALAERWLSGAGPVTLHEVASYHTMYACTAAGACVSIMPRSVAALMAGAPLPHVALGSFETSLVWREGFETPAFAAFREALGGLDARQDHRPPTDQASASAGPKNS